MDKRLTEIKKIREEIIASDVQSEDKVFVAEKVKGFSPTRLVLNRFFRSKLSIVGLCLIVFLFLFCFIGPLFSVWKNNPDTRNMGNYNYGEKVFAYTQDGETYEIYDITVSYYIGNVYSKPSFEHWLGTDGQGFDVLTRVMYGGRISLMLGFMVVFMATAIGVIMGGIAGYFGKTTDQIIMRIIDVFNCIPTLPILLIISAILEGIGIDPEFRIYWLMFILTFLSWSGTARMVRGQILSLREQEFMVATEAMGVSAPGKIFKHLIPNVIPQLIVAMTLSLGSVILYEATLSYLGLGAPLSNPAWGTMINSAKANSDILEKFLNIWMPPGICIILAVLGFNFMGDGLRDAFDPKMKR